MAPPITLWQRDSLQTDLSNVKNTFSSWDSCMAESYCKFVNIPASAFPIHVKLTITDGQ